MHTYICAVHECTQTPDLHVRTMHSHDSYELFYLLSGDADYRVEGSRYHLLPGDIILMRKGEVHMFQLRSPARYERMHINFDITELLTLMGTDHVMSIFHRRPLGMFNHYPASCFPENRWQEYMEKICRCDDTGTQICYLLPLLRDLSECFGILRTLPRTPKQDKAEAIIRYINANLSEDLSLELLTQRFYISKTHINRLFRQATGTTVWEYITIKRLFLAKELIAAGRQLSDLYTLCGFQDYSTFYRAYRQHFGISPREDIPKH